MNITKIAIDKITPYRQNSKLHPEEQIKQIKRSIEQFGFNDPLAVWGDDNIIVEGHGRLMACKELGYQEVDCIRLDHLTEEERKAYAIAHNSTNLSTGFDMDALLKELESIKIDMSGFGLQLPMPERQATDDGFDIDAEIENIKELRVHAGEIWNLGRHRLICGDSTKKDTLEALMPGETIDALITDPPYNVDYEGAAGKITNDALPPQMFYKFLEAAFGAAEKMMKPGAAFYVFHSSKEHTSFERALEANHLSVKQQLIWVKNSFVLGLQDYQWKHEPILYGWKDGAAHYFTDSRTDATVIEEEQINIAKMSKSDLKELVKKLMQDRIATTIIREDKPSRNDIHPTMKPIPIIGMMISNSSREDNIIFDGFGGGGTTLIACEQLRRICRIAEIDPIYATAILIRWEKLTGKAAEKEGESNA